MNEWMSVLVIVNVLLNVVGFGVLIVKGGVALGTAKSNFIQLFNTQDEIKSSMAAHVLEDRESFEKVNLKLTDIQIAAAAKK